MARAAAVGLFVVTLASCGSSSGSPKATPAASPAPPASAAPSDAAAAGSPAASAGASPAPSTTADPSATPIPSFTRSAELEALLPKTLDGKALAPTSLSGTDVLASGRPEDVAALQALLAATGGQPADYGFAYAVVPGPSAVGVFRIRGADAAKVRDSLIEQGKVATGGAYVVDSGTIGGKPGVTIVRFNQGGTAWSTYYWPKGDILYYAQATDPAIAEAFFSSL